MRPPRFFLLLDSFGVGINFYYKGHKDYRSHFGGFVTVVIYIATIICGIIFARELYNKISPTVSTSYMNYPNPKKISYPDQTFFILGLTVNSAPFVDPKIYRPIGYIDTKVNGSDILERRNLTVELCDKVIKEDYKYYDIIKHLNLKNFYCISLDQSKYGVDLNDLYINEFWGNDGFQMLQIKIFNCSAIADDKSECESNDVIKEKLTSPIITYYTLRNYIDTNNYKNPFVSGLQETFYYISYKKFVSATQYLKHLQVHTDKGYLFTDEEIIEDQTVDSMVDYSEADQEDGKIFTISIQLTNKIEIYSRSYFKLQDLAAEVGAVYGVMNMVFAVLFQLYNNSKLFSNIINKFFLIQEDFTPLNREKRSFINLKKKFYKDLNIVISLQKQSFNINHNSFTKSSNNNINFLNELNQSKKNPIKERYINTSETLNSPHIQEKRGKNNNFLNNVLDQKKEEEKKKIKIDFTYVDRFICLYLISLCRKRVNKYSYYNLFYKGKDYIIEALDITNYLKYNNFLQMIILINNKKTRELYEYVTTPILSTNYVGPRFEVEK